MRNSIYKQWSEQFLVSKIDQTYVRTTKNSEKEGTTVLSEAQSYGMLITVLAAKKGQASQEDFESLYRYYLNHRVPGTELMSWKQVIKNDTQTVERQMLQMEIFILLIPYWKLQSSGRIKLMNIKTKPKRS